MANKRLIDADAFKMLLEEIRQEYLEEDTYSSNFAAEVIETVQDEYLANSPTVDAVEVVRCKDCKHRAIGDDVCIHPNRIGDGYIEVKDDDFCSYGERKDND